MRKIGLLKRLEESRDVLNACIESLLSERVIKEDMEEAMMLAGQLLDAAKENLQLPIEDIYSPEDEELYDSAIQLVTEKQKAGVAMLQRYFNIGYGRAARLIDMMVEREVITPADSKKGRHKVLPPVE